MFLHENAGHRRSATSQNFSDRRHSAIDEESPGSISKSLTVAVAEDTSKIIFPLPSTASTDQFSSRRIGSLASKESRFQYPQTVWKKSSVLDKSPSPAEGKVSVKLLSGESAKPCEDSTRIPSSPEDTSDQEIVEVRKDSALFLEEAEGLPSLREILKSRSHRVNRPRRESSGYASNLGTFDEDRRNSSTVDVLQDFSLSFKERRRSSTGPKRLNSRILLSRPEENLTEGVESERMPTTEVHRKVSNTGFEMPNIEETKETLRGRETSLGDNSSLVNRVSPTIFDSSLCDSINRMSMSSPTSRSSVQIPSISDSSCIKSANIVGPVNRSDEAFSKLKTINSEKCRGFVSETKEDPLRTDKGKLRDQMTQKSVKDNVYLNIIPRPVKMYQLLSTQSEDRVDNELQLDSRIAFQVSKQDDVSACVGTSSEPRNASSNIFTLKGSISSDIQTLTSDDDSNIRNVISTGEAGGQRYLGDASSVSVRPIYPYCPYSPYGSPQGSPRNRRRPLRESRRVSIDNRQGALQLNQYKLLDNIGQGSYGIVKLVYNEEDDTHYAMKILSKKKLMKKAGIFGRMAPGKKGAVNPLAKVYREIALLKKLDHPNVVKLVEVLDDPDEDNLYLVFELVQRGEILQVPTDQPLHEETARKNFRDIVLGVEYLHYQRIVHRDIKPSNLLVDSEGRIKIADLGVSAELRGSGELLSGPAGTPAFAAPETTVPGSHYSGPLCDVWSMGVTLYCLVTGRIPWDGAGSIIGVQAAIRTEPLRFPERPALSEDLRELITKMLAKDPTERITLAEMKEHAWLTNRGVEPLPSESENCRLPVTVTDEEVERVVTRIPKLDTLILIKTMLKQHSFQNPFLPKKGGKAAGTETVACSIELTPSESGEEALQGTKMNRNVKSERFQRTGRSNSAPDSYDWQVGRQISMDSPLPPVSEVSTQETEIEKR
ncbi:probable serine/threonine-protein kinase dyrk2 isoform X2 [Ceratina calcarata]|uniref:calcium/calmodulin-dependent protein kinase n=1 Tax=Ceratina calcarata TaxID=156304 RepID=A0AAJ7W833_9HYME|nr:probable serine/threonine-protein kinase dyrk2 isoform X2 [Ceratina calcarata]